MSRDLDQAPQSLRAQVWIPVPLDRSAQRRDRLARVARAPSEQRVEAICRVATVNAKRGS